MDQTAYDKKRDKREEIRKEIILEIVDIVNKSMFVENDLDAIIDYIGIVKKKADDRLSKRGFRLFSIADLALTTIHKE